ncbi:putative Ig domain-containing protein [Granulicella sp. S190]|uniref:putative Ig domain-containing protein n=1 Tax=Granulicella sp. S190 TaxID=1747226 RepID=UPI00131E7222|nr:putative Ig domain-containing protein [Granulicella sp. S190]
MGKVLRTIVAGIALTLIFFCLDSASPSQTANAATALAISTTTLPQATYKKTYSATLKATGGTLPYDWKVAAGAHPSGCALNSGTGLFYCTPEKGGSYPLTFSVTDSSKPAQTKTVKITFVVATPALAITTTALPAATESAAYSTALVATGGTPSYAWSITAGKLPAGLTLADATGTISGKPTVTGTFSITAAVKDSSSPAVAKSATLSIAVGTTSKTPLSITSATLPSGVDGTAYSAQMKAAGGTPAYTWSITAGKLPAGLTLAATTGIISGKPTVTGTSAFTAAVTDNSNPDQSKSAATSITVGTEAPQQTGSGTTWYIRGDGGTRYSSKVPTGQCDGKADVGYPGSGTDQHCAFNDYRFLYDDQSYHSFAWVIAGGDTVIIRNGPYRVGYNQGTSSSDVWCNGTGDPYDCMNPVIPSGTATQPTRILGENYASCTQANMTQLYGGHAVWADIDLRGAKYVTIQCLNLTRHSQCIIYGSPASPGDCSNNYPIDDYAVQGLVTNTSTHDVTLTDMWIHGFPSRGILGPIGGTINATRVDIAYNGGAGWDFDDGQQTPNINGVINLSYVTVEWNGCNQAYPGTGAVSCYSQSTGGYGDGIGTPAGTCLTAHVDHSTFRYNTQDGYDMLHNDTGSCSMSITDSTAYGNNGAQFKWGPNDNPMVFTNNTVLGNCLRLSQPMTGQPSTYNKNLEDFCRANNTIAIGFRDGGTTTVENNTIVSYAPVTVDASCWGTGTDAQGTGTCNNSNFIFKNNIVMGYDNSATYDLGGQAGGPAAIYFDEPIGHVTRTNNLFYGIGHNFACPTGFSNELCADPLFTSQPTFTSESSLDNFNFQLTTGSPALHLGVAISGLTTDYTGATRANPPSIGAYEK